MRRFDYLLVGGGLQNGLIAVALRARRREVRVALVERGDRMGGNHIWCFHAGDVALSGWLEPLVVHRWASYEVRFPGWRRTLGSAYAAVTCERLHDVVARAMHAPGSALLTDAEAIAVSAHQVALADGHRLDAEVVVDSRGPDVGAAPAARGFQKFVGLEVVLRRPHDIERPIVMDATVEQIDGFRFVYVLPLDALRVLVEDTYFSDDSRLDVPALSRRVMAYAAAHGLEIASVRRQETGVLPLPWTGRFATPTSGPLVGGYRGGWFHPTTGYSFPVAARVADHVAGTEPGELFGADLRALARAHRDQLRFAHRLNRMLFEWFSPAARRNVLERFYRLPEATIARFYALQLTAADRARILLGRPPRGLSLRGMLAGARGAH